MSITDRVIMTIHAQRGHLLEWVPVCLALGIGLYFSLRFEPSTVLFTCVGGLGLLGLGAGRFVNEGLGPFVFGLSLVCFGFSLGAMRAHHLEAPVLGWRYYGVIEGRIVGIDRSASDALRLTLDQVQLERISPHRIPKRVRISLLHREGNQILPQAGAQIKTTGHLLPPNGPVEPMGFDFQRHAWFGQLGAVGYTRKPVSLEPVSLEEGETTQWAIWILNARMRLSAHVRRVLSGDAGGFAAAVITGDRSGISQEALTHLRASNTAHLLAISGLHMGLVSGFIFAGLRLILILLPYLGLRLPARKMAALGALIFSAGYLLLSGGNVATERAFVMVALALCAVMLERRVISLRTVAIAAVIVLLLRPEALLGPGFQMSFSATTALVAVFGWMRARDLRLGPKWMQPFVFIVISSTVAGLATAPIGAAYFNTVAHYGLLANLLSVPLMGLVVVPCGVLAMLLMPFGADFIGLWIMGIGLRWILNVAQWISELEGARGYVMAPPSSVLPLLALGGLWLILWQGRLRGVGLAAIGAGFLIWAGAERPLVLIANNGSLVGVMTPNGRALSKEKGAGFVARNWLQDDGDSSLQREAAHLWQDTVQTENKRVKSAQIGAYQLIHLIGKKALAAQKNCHAGQIIVASVKVERDLGPCLVFDPYRLRAQGAIGIYQENSRVKIVSARDISGERLWSTWPRAR